MADFGTAFDVLHGQSKFSAIQAATKLGETCKHVTEVLVAGDLPGWNVLVEAKVLNDALTALDTLESLRRNIIGQGD